MTTCSSLSYLLNCACPANTGITRLHLFYCSDFSVKHWADRSVYLLQKTCFAHFNSILCIVSTTLSLWCVIYVPQSLNCCVLSKSQKLILHVLCKRCRFVILQLCRSSAEQRRDVFFWGRKKTKHIGSLVTIVKFSLCAVHHRFWTDSTETCCCCFSVADLFPLTFRSAALLPSPPAASRGSAAAISRWTDALLFLCVLSCTLPPESDATLLPGHPSVVCSPVTATHLALRELSESWGGSDGGQWCSRLNACLPQH